MKAGVVGGGNWGKNIAKNLFALESLGAIVEIHENARRELAELYPAVPIYSSAEELYATDIRAVCIATPAGTHFSLAKQALESGKDTYVEKPLALSFAEGQRLVEIAKDHDRILMVGHLLLYQPALAFVKKSIDEGLIGEVYSFHQERMNLGRARAVENVLWSFGVHDVAALLYLAGEAPTKVVSSGQCALQKHIEDDFYVHMVLESGRQAHVHSSWLWPELRRRLTVVGSTGMLVYDEIEQKVTLHRKRIDSELKNVNEGEEVVFSGAGEPLKLELQHFLHCCETRTQPISDGPSAVDVLRVLEQASPALSSV